MIDTVVNALPSVSPTLGGSVGQPAGAEPCKSPKDSKKVDIERIQKMKILGYSKGYWNV